VEFEQGGKVKAGYGSGLIERLSKDLSLSYGKGFSLSNIKRFRKLYLTYLIGEKVSHQLENKGKSISKGATLSHQLSWSNCSGHIVLYNSRERSLYNI